MQKIIELHEIQKSFQVGDERLDVLKDIDLEVKKGEFVAIQGPSGSGKSTLMNIIGCMDLADDGEYQLAGQEIKKMKEDQLANIRNHEIGFVFQKYHLIPKYNVEQNIIMPLLMRGESYAQAVSASEKQMQLLGIADRRKHKPNELSGGQQQRVAIARALVGQPSVILADEPTGALDSVTSQEVLELFSKLNDMGHTILMITHDNEVAGAAGRVVHIRDGRLAN